jgi:hypothetical protein
VAMNAPLLVFHQCMDLEWLAWGRASAEAFAALGFGVVRVRTCPWRELKEADPVASRNPYKEEQAEQQMICTIMMRDVTVPTIAEIAEFLQSGFSTGGGGGGPGGGGSPPRGRSPFLGSKSRRRGIRRCTGCTRSNMTWVSLEIGGADVEKAPYGAGLGHESKRKMH